MVFTESASENIRFLIPTILERKTIKQLFIQSSSITRDDILSFSQLSTNRSLTTLALFNDSISDDGVIALAKLLQDNETLENLYLEHNSGITSDSAKSLAELLLTNETLTYLDLYRTNIDAAGVLVLIASLKTNNTLKTLRLDRQHEETCSTVPYCKNILYFF